MTNLTKAQIQARMLKGAGQSGSSRRSRALGDNDPRHRRGAQAEGMAMQRFHPDHFEVDDEQRLKLSEPPSSRAFAIATVLTGSVAGPTVFTNVTMTAAANSINTESDPLITVNDSTDDITLRAGYAYRVDFTAICKNTSTSVSTGMSIQVIEDDGSTLHGSRFATLAQKSAAGLDAIRTAISTSGAVDLRSASKDVTLSFQVKGLNANASNDNGFITIQTL